MTSISRLIFSLLLVIVFLSAGFTCGPGYISPMFDTGKAPEAPYTDFAAGRLGIVKKEYPRAVLYAAYRWIAGNGMSRSEQTAAIEVWRADIDNRDFRDDSVDDAVKAWVAKRSEVMGKDDKAPAIYTEREYGGYDFFPNCTRNAFETATETLSDRASAHGPTDANVLDWVRAQDAVFENCATSKQAPADPTPGAPDWLQKDRAYQKAAAEFYSLDYNSAKKHFAEIATDTESPWAETADYLVARTLIRQASLSKSKSQTAALYAEAEAHLERFVSTSGKFGPSANRLMGLVKYRNHPEQRVTELAKNLTIYVGGSDNFRQDLIDYTWLLDKFESDILTAEEARKKEERERGLPLCHNNVPSGNNDCRVIRDKTSEEDVEFPYSEANAEMKRAAGMKEPSDLELRLYFGSSDYTVYVRVGATDDEAIAEVERVVGRPLTKENQEQVRQTRQAVYAARFSDRKSGYEGNYWGEEKMTPSLLPAFLRQDEVTDWLYSYQISGAESYLHALQMWKATGSELWLMTALSKAEKSSTDLARITEAGRNASMTSPAYPTIAYHTARILLEQGKQAEARKLVDEMLDMGDRLPVSARNSFIDIKAKFAETLEDFLSYSLKRPFAFDFDGEIGSVEDIIEEQKKWYNPEYNKDGREAYDKEIEDNYKTEKLWQDRGMFDSDVIDKFNRIFPTSMLVTVKNSPALPEYMRERFAIAIWTRAYILGDRATLLKFTPELAQYEPDWAGDLGKITAARTPAAQDSAILYFVLKNPLLSPYIEDGIGKSDNEQGQWDGNDWWCAPYDTEWSESAGGEVPLALPKRPAFLTPAQVQAAQAERTKLRDAGDAPKYLGAKVLQWAKTSPTDRRIPEALYIMIEANGWTKYGCGNDEELQGQLTTLLKKRYPSSPWAAKLIREETENQ